MRNLVPLNAYAQYVLTLTVAMVPGISLVSADESLLPDPADLNVHSAVPEPQGFFAWLRRHALGVGLVVVLVALVVRWPCWW